MAQCDFFLLTWVKIRKLGLELCPLALRCMGVHAGAMGVRIPMLRDILEIWIRLLGMPGM